MRLIIAVFFVLLFSNISFAKKANLGTCKNFDEHIKNCKPINCSFRLPYENASATVQLLIIGEKNSRCYYRQFSQFQSNAITYTVRLKYDCILSKLGKEEVLKSFENYKAGDDIAYRSTPDTPILHKECKVRD